MKLTPLSKAASLITRFLRSHAVIIVFVFVFLASLYVRVSAVGYPRNPEIYRDYLVSNHIVRFSHERPLTGASNNVFPVLRSSATYPYLWAACLWLYNHFLTLTVVQIVLQMLALLAIYAGTKHVFGAAAGLFASVWFGLGREFVSHTQSIWQPYTMEVFLYIAWYFFGYGFEKKSSWALSAAGVLLVFGGSFHYSAYTLIPVYIIGALLLFRYRLHCSWLESVVRTVVPVGIMLLVQYTSVLLYLQNMHFTFTDLGLAQRIVSGEGGGGFLSHLVANVHIVIKHIFQNQQYEYILKPWVVGSAIVLLICYTLYKRAGKSGMALEQKYVVAGLVLAALTPLVVLAFFSGVLWPYYFIPTYFALIILCAACISHLFHSKKIAFLAYVCAVLFVMAMQPNWEYAFAQIPPAEYTALQRGWTSDAVAAISKIQKYKGTQDVDFFQLWLIQGNTEHRGHDAMFWSWLEEYYNTQFVRVVDYGNSYEYLNSDEYYFVICEFGSDSEVAVVSCLDHFHTVHPEYALETELGQRSPYQTFVMKKSALFSQP